MTGAAPPTARRILVLDDSPTVRAHTERALRAAGYDVDSAMDVDELVRKLEESDPDLILIDVMMPDIYGHDLVCWLREVRRTRAAIALYSTLSALKLEEHVSASGADGYVVQQPDQGAMAMDVARILEARDRAKG